MTATAEPRVLVPLRLEEAAPALGAHQHRLSGSSMGTGWSLQFVASAQAQQAQLADWQALVEAELALVIAQMSSWEAGSLLSRFNRAEAGKAFTLPAAFREVLDSALQVAKASGGAFDASAGALIDAWGFGAQAPRYDHPDFQPPCEALCRQALAASGWQRLSFDAAGRLIQPGGLRLDFSGIAKGHAVDRIALALQDAGVRHLLVEIGGELRGHGLRPDGQPWWVELERPEGCALPPTRVALHGLAVATSGDYRRFFRDAQGRRRPHSIDPRDGQPIRNRLASVSVLHAQCMAADAWATALTVLGPEAGLALARAQGLAALFLLRHDDGRFEEILTPALQELAA